MVAARGSDRFVLGELSASLEHVERDLRGGTKPFPLREPQCLLQRRQLRMRTVRNLLQGSAEYRQSRAFIGCEHRWAKPNQVLFRGPILPLIDHVVRNRNRRRTSLILALLVEGARQGKVFDKTVPHPLLDEPCCNRVFGHARFLVCLTYQVSTAPAEQQRDRRLLQTGVRQPVRRDPSVIARHSWLPAVRSAMTCSCCVHARPQRQAGRITRSYADQMPGN